MNVLCLGLRRMIQVAHPNLFSFIKHLQNVTTDNMTDMERVRNGLPIRRPKKKRNIQNDTRIKASIQRFDSGPTHACSFSVQCATVLARTRRRFSSPLTSVTTTLTMEPTLSLRMMHLRSRTQQPILTMPLSRQATPLLSCARCSGVVVPERAGTPFR